MTPKTRSILAVELFAGIGGFRIAADKNNIKTIWSNDIDVYASKVYCDNFGNDTHHNGDIRLLKHNIPKHDLLLAGFPCQSFSSAGKKTGILDSRGTLFKEIVEILRKHKPEHFILENVKRLLNMKNGSQFSTIINALSECGYLIEWRLLNAKNFGLPQNRERVIITGRLNNIFISKLSDKTKKEIPDYKDWNYITDNEKGFSNWGMAYDKKFFSENITDKVSISVKLKDILQNKVDDKFDFTDETLSRLKSSSIVQRFVDDVEVIGNQKGGSRMGYTVFGINGIAPTLTSSASRHYERYRIDDKFRRLTNIEYARIQGFKDDHCDIVDERRQYILYGNAVPPQMIDWVIDKLITE